MSIENEDVHQCWELQWKILCFELLWSSREMLGCDDFKTGSAVDLSGFLFSYLQPRSLEACVNKEETCNADVEILPGMRVTFSHC